MGQSHRKIMKLAFNPADNSKRLAKVNLSMAGGMGQRHKHFTGSAFCLSNIIRHNRNATREPVIVTKTLINPLRRVALLFDQILILCQNLINEARKRIQLRANRRAIPTITRGQPVLQNLRNRRKRSPRPIDVFSLGRLTLFGMVRLCARQGVPGELISEGVATA